MSYLKFIAASLSLCTFAAMAAAQSAPGFKAAGKWDYSIIAGHEEEKSTLWTEQVGATASWFPAFDGPVTARVHLHKIVHSKNNDPEVRVEVVHKGETTGKTLDFSSGKTGWEELGVFEFAGTAEECVKLTKLEKPGVLRASAVRFDILAEGNNPEVIQTFTIDDLKTDTGAFSAKQLLPPGGLRTERTDGPPANGDWQLSFREEFDQPDLNTEVWAFESGSPGHILSSRWRENIEIKEGILRLLTRKEERGGRKWTTGNIWTKSFRQKYGYFEARMRIGNASGLNNAFWLMTTHKPSDPQHFEIDIVEAHYPNRLHLTLHNWAGEHWAKSEFGTAPFDLSEDFHTYGLEWNEKELIWFFDGHPVFRLPNPVCHEESPVRLSSAVGRFAGRITDALDGTKMEVDWVRIYKRPEIP